MSDCIRLGKIGYLNVLPLYHPLETGLVPNDFEIVSGPPSRLNKLMAEGFLHVSANSSIEYARHADQYYLVPDLAIGSCGPVMSVLLLSRVPVLELDGETILVSSQTHTSAALLRVLMREHFKIAPNFVTGDASSALEEGQEPKAMLAIGDEALRLRRHPDYPVLLDLGETWSQWTGLPFIFGVWLMQRDMADKQPQAMSRAVDLLARAKAWGRQNMELVVDITREHTPLDCRELTTYYNGLCYDFGDREQQGLKAFFQALERTGAIADVPELTFFQP